ncbi:hypothetical protein [Rariglobus hedericola]|uniref:Uncharacterized protein n=1 Tax=Rariglobus hedericola TaxID=2597822 RepID=A0A556QJG1_9BACT|nr:hypothetical protein [Rariglobus hedericola]TSJ76769.1 hypothetical protein FPL22_11630 [Rariglobus hedericola]
MKTLLTFMLMALAYALPSSAVEPVASASFQEVQASLKKDLTSIKLRMTTLKPKVQSDIVRGTGVTWVEILADSERLEIAAGAVNPQLPHVDPPFPKVINALERGRNNAKLLGTVEGNKLAFEIDGVLKIIDELKKNPQALSQDWPKKAKALLVYLQ